MKVFIVLAVLIMQVITLRQWFTCHNFTELFHQSEYEFRLQLDDFIHNDRDEPVYVTRFFHNKFIVLFIDIYRHYVFYWDFRFLVSYISLLGVFGLISGFWYFHSKKNRTLWSWVIFVTVLFYPFIELIFNPHVEFVTKSTLYSIPLGIFSVFGLWKFTENTRGAKKYVALLFLIIISVYWQIILPSELINYCT